MCPPVSDAPPFAFIIMTEFGDIRSARRTRKAAKRYIDRAILRGVDGSSRWWLKPVIEGNGAE